MDPVSVSCLSFPALVCVSHTLLLLSNAVLLLIVLLIVDDTSSSFTDTLQEIFNENTFWIARAQTAGFDIGTDYVMLPGYNLSISSLHRTQCARKLTALS